MVNIPEIMRTKLPDYDDIFVLKIDTEGNDPQVLCRYT